VIPQRDNKDKKRLKLKKTHTSFFAFLKTEAKNKKACLHHKEEKKG